MDEPKEQFDPAHPFTPSGWTAPKDPIDKAVERFHAQEAQAATPLKQFQTPSGYQNLDIILARINRIEQMIDGATISATCNATTSTITVTLDWGA